MCLTNTKTKSQKYYLTGHLLTKIPIGNKIDGIIQVPIVYIN